MEQNWNALELTKEFTIFVHMFIVKYKIKLDWICHTYVRVGGSMFFFLLNLGKM